jgi:hypothetical protein
MTIIILAAVLFPCVASAGVKIGNVQFDDRGKIIFANTTSAKIIFPDKTEQGSATAKGDKGDKGYTGDKGDKGEVGPKGDPGQVDKAAICKVYADEGITLPAFCSKKIIFLTSQAYDGNLGGLAGADAKCQSLAAAANLSGTFKAWLSDSTTNASDRLTHNTGSYVRTDGAVVAINWLDLIDSNIKEPIICDENKECLTSLDSSLQYVWTGSVANGKNNYIFNCADWTYAIDPPPFDGECGPDRDVCGSHGEYLSINSWWSYRFNISCHFHFRLYCIEQ